MVVHAISVYSEAPRARGISCLELLAQTLAVCVLSCATREGRQSERTVAQSVCLVALEAREWLLYRRIDTRYRRIPTVRPQKARSH
eukprot:6187277-Pleurochrysis_carterae.AAC.3